MLHKGGCHCGNVELEFTSDIPPADIEIRECQCDFCRKHGAIAMSDPNGKLSILVNDRNNLNLYAFGLQTADFIVCAKCGVYVAAITKDKGAPRGIAIVNSFQNRTQFSSPAIPASYDSEDKAGRIDRRRKKWIPATITFLTDQ